MPPDRRTLPAKLAKNHSRELCLRWLSSLHYDEPATPGLNTCARSHLSASLNPKNSLPTTVSLQLFRDNTLLPPIPPSLQLPLTARVPATPTASSTALLLVHAYQRVFTLVVPTQVPPRIPPHPLPVTSPLHVPSFAPCVSSRAGRSGSARARRQRRLRAPAPARAAPGRVEPRAPASPQAPTAARPAACLADDLARGLAGGREGGFRGPRGPRRSCLSEGSRLAHGGAGAAGGGSFALHGSDGRGVAAPSNSRDPCRDPRLRMASALCGVARPLCTAPVARGGLPWSFCDP